MAKQDKTTAYSSPRKGAGKGRTAGRARTRVEKKKDLFFAIVILLALLMALVLVFPWLIELPKEEQEEKKTVIRNENGVLTAETQLAIFDSVVSPGSEGSYTFFVDNPYSIEYYSVEIEEWLQGEAVTTGVPIVYRLKLNDEYLKGGEWRTIDDFSFDSVRLTKGEAKLVLEWKWPYESGNDALDTYLGSRFTQYAIKFTFKSR